MAPKATPKGKGKGKAQAQPKPKAQAKAQAKNAPAKGKGGRAKGGGYQRTALDEFEQLRAQGISSPDIRRQLRDRYWKHNLKQIRFCDCCCDAAAVPAGLCRTSALSLQRGVFVGCCNFLRSFRGGICELGCCSEPWFCNASAGICFSNNK